MAEQDQDNQDDAAKQESQSSGADQSSQGDASRQESGQQGVGNEQLFCPYCGGRLTPEELAVKQGGPLTKAAWEGIYSLAFMVRRRRFLCLNPKCNWGYYPRTHVRFVKGLAFVSKNSIFEEHLINDAIRRTHRQRKTLGQRLKQAVKSMLGIKDVEANGDDQAGEALAKRDDGTYRGANPLAATGGAQSHGMINSENSGQGNSNSAQGYSQSEDDGAYRGEVQNYAMNNSEEEDDNQSPEENSSSTSRAGKVRRA